MSRPYEPPEKLDDEEEDDHRDHQKVDHFPEEEPVRDFFAMDHRFPLEVTLLARHKHADQRHNNVLDQRVDDLAECRADDHPNGQIDDIAFEGELFEFLKQGPSLT